jgi:hypothetical protein
MKNQILNIVVFILLILLLSSLILLNKYINLCKFHEDRVTILHDHVEEAFHINNLKANFLSEIISTSYESFNTKELYRDSIRHLLLVSRAGCSSCISHLISIVESYNRQYSYNIGIVFSNETVRGLQLYKRTNKTISNLFVTRYSEELEDKVEHSPLLVDLEEDGSILRIFRPIPEFPKLTDKFLESSTTK